MLLFAIFSLAAGFSQTGKTLDTLCGVLGVFSASAVPPAQGMLGTIYKLPSPRKNRAFGCFSSGNPLGFVVGAILGGVFTQVFNWRAPFYMLAIVYLVISIVAFFTVPEDSTVKRKLDQETIKRLDIPGTAMTIAGIGMFCAALRFVSCQHLEVYSNDYSLGGDAKDGFRTPYVLVLLIIGILLIVAFIVWENKYPYALIDMSVWKDRDFSLVSLIPWAATQIHGRYYANESNSYLQSCLLVS